MQRFFLILSIIGVVVSIPYPARASLLFTLDQPVVTGNPGSTIDVSGSLINTDLAPVFLNTVSGILASADLDFDLTDFFTVVPASLNFGDSYTGPIFGVIIDTQARPGDYFGSFDVFGGLDSSAFEDLATQNFQVTVTAALETPEPIIGILGTTVFIIAFGLLGRRAQLSLSGKKRRTD